MATMKGNKGKEVAAEGTRLEGEPQSRPHGGEKRKTLSRTLDLGNLPSRRSKKIKQVSSQARVNLPPSQPPTQVVDVDSSTPIETPPSKTPTPTTTIPTSSQPSQRVASNIVENEDLAWERFQNAVLEEDINACYDMSLREFEHSGVHDLFKAMSKFMAASKQATELDKTRVLLETRIQEVKAESKKWAEVAASANEKAKELENLIEELRSDAVEKDTRLDHLQKKNDELSSLLSQAREDAVKEFRASKNCTDLLDTNYAAGFEDFRMEAMENFPEVDFSSIKLNLGAAATSSLLQTGSEDVNIEDDASTLPPQDDSHVDVPPS
ncbi:uncharacterized protein LOC112032943 [Quercus suber]|uniref:uncharacterized protein LOC112032943 n=1 Tax=Quercus suber TaxID=58331 RepID=UPI000CE18FE8|nr:uncharacterized protein LOC112032943 [Quercus suber]